MPVCACAPMCVYVCVYLCVCVYVNLGHVIQNYTGFHKITQIYKIVNSYLQMITYLHKCISNLSNSLI